MHDISTTITGWVRSGLFALLFCAINLAPQVAAEANIPGDVRGEVEEVKSHCYATSTMRNKYDCECMAETFAQKRLAMGPERGKEAIVGLITLYGECLNLPAIQRNEYAYCMNGRSFDTNGIDKEKYCQCYSHQAAKNMNEHTGKLGASGEGSMKFRATMYCRKKEAYP